MESPVESGRVDRHRSAGAHHVHLSCRSQPWQRRAEGGFPRRGRQRSRAGVLDRQPSIPYNAFDKDLQLWVAACLYKGAVDVYRIFVGEMDEETAERRLPRGDGTRHDLQVPPGMWPADRAAFERYWQQSLDKVHIDDAVREYLYPIAAGRMRGVKLPGPLQRWSDALPPADHDGLSAATISRRDAATVGLERQRDRPADGRHSRGQQPHAALHPAVPVRVLKDLDRRIRTGRPVV